MRAGSRFRRERLNWRPNRRLSPFRPDADTFPALCRLPTTSVPARASKNPTPRPWRRWLLPSLVGLAALAVGFLVPTWWVMDRHLQYEFGRLSWQIPTRVLARPLALRVGEPVSMDSLLEELAAAGYRDDGEGRSPGSYRRDGTRLWIASRGFRDVDGAVAARRIEVALSGQRIGRLLDAAGKPLAEAWLDPARIATFHGIAQEERRLARLEDLPALLLTTLQAVEDRSFRHHAGIDWRGMVRALWVNLREGEVRQGGSTLTQQLVRNLYLHRGQSYSRKLREILYAMIIESRFDKRRIMEAYLNQVYLGQQGGQAVHGVAAGAWFWFGREPDQLGPEEIALLIGLIKGPSYYDPRRYPERARVRRDLVLDQMLETGLIDAAGQARAKARPLGVTTRAQLAANRYPAFIELVRAQLASDYPPERLSGAGLDVLTTLAPSVQAAAERSVTTRLPELAKKDAVAPQAAMLVTDTASGEVLAIVGGNDPRQPGFNRALAAQRPVGSLLKPFVYLLALADPARWSLASTLEDAPITLRTSGSQQWRPENVDGVSHGPVALLDALAQSYNQATVRLGMAVGVDRLARLMKALAGVEPPAHPSLLLGAVDLSPLQVTSLYQFLASGGQVQRLRSVRGVLDGEGRPLHRYDDAPARAEPADAIATRLVTLALQEAAQRGTARRLSSDGHAHLAPAGKTGTSNDGRDSWFAGWTGRHLAVVWVGNDDNSPTGLYGATGALRLWSGLFAALPSTALQIDPGGLEWGWVEVGGRALTDRDCEGAREFAFVAGYAPREHRGCRLEQVKGWFDWRRDAP